jgi:hypothetical protein
MNLSKESFISPNFIVAEIAKKSGDPGFEYDSKGEYLTIVQEALTELSFDTYFLEVHKTFKLEENCHKLVLPSGFFNISKVYGHNSDECVVSNSENIWFKTNYRNGFSRNTGQNNEDPFHFNRHAIEKDPHHLYYCGIANGVIHLSKSCSKFNYVTVFANGLLADIGEAPVVPSFFRQAVIDYGVVNMLSIRIANAKENDMISKWQFVLNLHKERLDKEYDGSWAKAEYRVKNMDRKAREDYRVYFERLDY